MEETNQEKQIINDQDTIKSTIGRSHMAPTEYTYVLKCIIGIEFLCLLDKEKNNFMGNLDNPKGPPYIVNGYNKVNDTDIWVINQEKQGYYYLWFKTKSDAENLYNYVYEKKALREKKTVNPIYKFTKTGWQQLNTYSGREVDDLIGYQDYLNTVNKDLSNYKKYLDFLKKIGEGHRTLNYLLYGPPGTGKTTIIKTLATMHNLPIYIVNPTLMDNVSASTLLNPKTSTHTNRIILFEDFDRYLKEGKYSMSEILNELDGVESTEGCIRFFTCNDVEEIYKHDALINRMSAKFEFNYPTIDDFKAKLNRFLTFWSTNDLTKLDDQTKSSNSTTQENWLSINEEKISQFIKLFDERNNLMAETKGYKLTLRPFSNYIIRYLFDENCMDQLIENINELIK